MSLSYSFREGLAGFSRTKFAAFASTSAMTVALFLIGLFALAAFEAQQVSDWLRQHVGEVEVFLVQDAGEEEAESLRQQILQTSGVAEATYISPEEAAETFQEEFGEGGDIFLDDPFLPASIRVQAEPGHAHPDSLSLMADEFEAWSEVDEVVFDRPLLAQVEQNRQLLTQVGGAFGILVVIASVVLVANTIRLTIYARRLLIRTMKLVGATDSFIRRPFLVEGMLQGLIAGGIAGGGLWAAYAAAADRWGFVGGTSALEVGAVLAGGLIVLGMILGLLGSYLAARRFIKNVALH